MRWSRSGAALLFAVAFPGRQAGAVIGPPPPTISPYAIPGPYATAQTQVQSLPVAPAVMSKITGHIESKNDPSHFFDNVSAFTNFSATITLSADITNQASHAQWTNTDWADCGNGFVDSICTCSCAAVIPTLATNCPSSSWANNPSCFDNAIYGSSRSFVTTAGDGQGFTLTFADGSSLAQNPTQSMFAYDGNPVFPLAVHAGPASGDLFPFDLPSSNSAVTLASVSDATVNCSSSTYANFCNGQARTR